MKHVVATWNCREPSQHLLKDPGKPGKTCVGMAGHRTFWLLTCSQPSGILKKRKKERKKERFEEQKKTVDFLSVFRQ